LKRACSILSSRPFVAILPCREPLFWLAMQALFCVQSLNIVEVIPSLFAAVYLEISSSISLCSFPFTYVLLAYSIAASLSSWEYENRWKTMPSGSDSSGSQCIRQAVLNCPASWSSYREPDIHCRFTQKGTLDISFAGLPGLIRTVDEPEKSRTVWPRSGSFGRAGTGAIRAVDRASLMIGKTYRCP
jgi:hypothetical protein